MRYLSAFSALLIVLGILGGCSKKQEPAPTPAAPAVETPAAEAPAEQPAVVEPAVQALVEQTADPQAVVVTVNGQKVIESQVAAEVEKRIQARMKMIPPGMEVPQERLKMLRDQTRMQVTEMLVDKMLIDIALKEKNITVTPEQAEAGMKKFAEENGMTPEQMTEQITRAGMTLDDVREQFLTREKIEALLKTQIGDGQVTEAEAKTFYDENIQQFSQPEMVTASHILLKTQGKTDEEKAAIHKQMEGILARAQAGEDFAALAKEFSEDPGSKDKGGEYTFPRGQMVKPFEDAAFGQEDGKISPIVETQFGYHIIKTTDHKEAGTQSFEEVKGQLMEQLSNQKQSEAWQAFQKQMRDSAKIEWSAAEQARRDAMAQPQAMPRPVQPAPAPSSTPPTPPTPPTPATPNPQG
jgi:peptidyl-prolyl cis-trans isomerase C